MSELSPEALALLEDARRSHGPSERDRERVLSTLHASLGIAVPLALASSVAEAAVQAGSPALNAVTSSGVQVANGAQSVLSSAASGAGQAALKLTGQTGWSYAGKLLTWKAGKLFLATVALGGAVGVGVTHAPRAVVHDAVKPRTMHAIARAPEARAPEGTFAGQSTLAEQAAVAVPPQLEPAATPSEPMPAPSEPAATPLLLQPDAQQEQATDQAAPVPPASRVGHRASARTPEGLRARAASHSTRTVRTHVHRERVQPRAPEPVAAAEAPVTAAPQLAAPPELELIRKAMTSLRDRDPSRALSLLEEHASRYPGGSFATERQGLHAIALCAAGRTAEGKSEQASFLRQQGQTPIAARVRRACTEPKQ